MALRTSTLGIELIKAFEGCRLKAYRCPAGVWTVGYGHTSAAGDPRVVAGMKITAEDAVEILRDDIDAFEDGVERLLGQHDDLEEHQFDALVSLAFNIGLGAFGKSTVLKRIKAGKLDRVPEAIMWWNKVKGRELAGLTRRRRAEVALWRGDAQDATKDTQADFGPMPQAVDVPQPPKTITQSSTAGAAVITGAAGAVGTIAAGQQAVEAARQVSGMATEAARLGNTLWALGPWVLLLLVIVGGAAWIIRERRRKLIEDRV